MLSLQVKTANKMGEIEKTNFLNENTDLEEDIDISCDHSYEADRIVANTFLS